MQDQKVTIFGKHAATAAINNKKRKICKIFISEERRIEYKTAIPKSLKNKIEYISAKRAEKLCGHGNQGIAVVTEKLQNYSLKDLILNSQEKSLVIILDQITDPYNFGNIIRSSKAFCVDFIITQSKYSPKETSIIAKTASGALESIPICYINNLSTAINILKENDYLCYGLDCHTRNTIKNTEFHKRAVIIVGSEGLGIRNSLLKKCDLLMKIPMSVSSNFDSINVSNAAAIAAYSYYLDHIETKHNQLKNVTY